MNVLFISNDPLIFDETSDVRARLRSYAKHIGELHVLSRAPQGTAETQEGTLHLHPISTRKPFHLFALLRCARRIIHQTPIEVVSAQDPFEYGYLALCATRGTKAKLHIQIHTDALSPYFRSESLTNRVRVLIADYVLPRARGIRVVSERIARSLLTRYGTHIVEPTIIPVHVEEELHPKEPLPEHSFKFTLITIGRLEKEKRVEDIVRALAIVHRHYPNTGLFVVGEGRCRARLTRLSVRLGLTKNVRFLTDNTTARALIPHAQAFIQASAYEGYGRTLVEAALAETPIITTDVGIVGEVLRPATDALVTHPHNPGALAHAIMRLIEHNDLRYSLVKNAHERMCEHLAAYPDQPALIATDLARTLERSYG